jgi:hypothetical protein
LFDLPISDLRSSVEKEIKEPFLETPKRIADVQDMENDGESIASSTYSFFEDFHTTCKCPLVSHETRSDCPSACDTSRFFGTADVQDFDNSPERIASSTDSFFKKTIFIERTPINDQEALPYVLVDYLCNYRKFSFQP